LNLRQQEGAGAMGRKRDEKVTIADVASLAGVHTATAGRVLGGYGYASERIKAAVHRAAEQLGYSPNLLARGLITGKTRTIGVVAGDIQNQFYSSVLRGIADVARAHGFGVLLTNSDERLDRELEAVKLLREKQVDGLIVAPCDTRRSDHLRRALEQGCPVVQIDRIVRDLPADSVAVDNRAASHAATTRLIDAGHRRIGILAELEEWEAGDLTAFVGAATAGSLDPAALFPSWQRLLGYIEAQGAAGIKVNPELILRVGTYSVPAAKAQVLKALSGPERPTALFTADGLMTAAAVDAITTLDIQVPNDLSLIGFDDLDWMQFYRPRITAIAQPLTTMGEAAARMILDRIAGKREEPRHLALTPELVERDTVSGARDSFVQSTRP
jgi:LacI family transcriptional regulator